MRPKLEIDKLYYLKMEDVFIPGTWYQNGSGIRGYNHDGTFENHEYLVKVIRLDRMSPSEHQPFGCLRAGLQILASTQEPDSSEQWRPGDDCDFGWVRYVSVDQSYQKDRLVLMRLNPKRLPLYLNWPYGREFITQLLKEVPNGCEDRR
jgi:hypothetical protein